MFSNLKLGTKLALGFGSILVVLSIVAYLGFSRISGLSVEFNQVVNERLPKMEMTSDLVDSYQSMTRELRDISISKDHDFKRAEQDKYQKNKAKLFEILAKYEKVTYNRQNKEILTKVKETLAKISGPMDKAVDLGLANKEEEAKSVLLNEIVPLHSQLMPLFRDLDHYQEAAAKNEGVKAVEQAIYGKTFILLGSSLALIIGVIMAFFLTRSITKPINRSIAGLTDGAEQVAEAAIQVSAASQSLAQGASEQAASLEETTSSLEEMNSMTRGNADNARQADALMGEAARVVETANRSMGELTNSMSEVSAASEETAKIVKTIDEIAFQTNLLALNAAVEAARAGEAGAGFAVVADEVRNLAMRAADAAKNTANLIEGTVTKVKEGSSLVDKTATAFIQVSESTAKVKELVGEIAAASSEQAQGVEQINKAVSEMNGITQQVAANAEESASSSEELNAQAEQMKAFVGELTSIVRGIGNRLQKGQGGAGGGLRPQRAMAGELQVCHRPVPAKVLPAQRHKGKGLTPEQIIPLDEGEFKDF